MTAPREPRARSAHAATKEKILNAAERLFARNGLERVSMRDITQAASVNLAAINYHFGSKDGLIEAVFDRRLTPLNEQRLAALGVVEKAAGRRPPSVEEILGALIRPVVALALDPKLGAVTFTGLMGRCLAEPGELFEKLIQKHFETLVVHFHAALLRSIPHLSREEIFWRMHFTAGALHQSLLTMEKPLPAWLKGVLDAESPPLDAERQVRRLVAFAAAGLRAPSSTPAAKS
jgi:AcrR family transcriptional regulator